MPSVTVQLGQTGDNIFRRRCAFVEETWSRLGKPLQYECEKSNSLPVEKLIWATLDTRASFPTDLSLPVREVLALRLSCESIYFHAAPLGREVGGRE